jgi:hypothetical protein
MPTDHPAFAPAPSLQDAGIAQTESAHTAGERAPGARDRVHGQGDRCVGV